MTIFDLVLIFAVLGCVLALFSLFYFLMCRQWRRARRVFLAFGSFLVLYAALLLSVSLLSPQRMLAMHQDRCFDDWCLSVEQVVQQPTVGASPMVVTAHRSEEHTSELQSHSDLVCRLLLEKKKTKNKYGKRQTQR